AVRGRLRARPAARARHRHRAGGGGDPARRGGGGGGRGAGRARDTGTAVLVFSAAGAGRRVLSARLAMSLGLAWAVAMPALLKAFVGGDALAGVALLVVGASVAVSGLALATACRNPRPFELALVFLAYIGVQGDPSLNAMLDPALSLARHAWLLPAAALVLAVAWPLSLRRR
ncbi:MAG: hypothetical protein K0M64_07095, partial [Rhizobium sp.]|nr:hypothetical protein [Rhizobium sp.]